MRTTRLMTLAAAGAATALLTLTACSGGSDGATAQDAGGADMVAPAAGDMEEPAAAPDEATRDGSGGGGSASNAVSTKAVDLATQQALIKTGAVALRSADVGKTRYDVQVLVDEHAGQISDDKTETDKTGDPLRSRMVLRVPVDDFDETMDGLAKLATLASTTTSSEDVTTQLIDVEARIKVQQASVQRVRLLLSQAGTIREIMAIENELADRQAQLDSLLQQQAYLKDQTSMSTIKVNIERLPDPKVVAKAKNDDDGFIAGLSAGWKGLGNAAVAVATVIGAVLPFAVVGLLVGVPVWLLARRLRRSPAPVAPAPAASGE
jgi:hypothetical protein